MKLQNPIFVFLFALVLLSCSEDITPIPSLVPPLSKTTTYINNGESSNDTIYYDLNDENGYFTLGVIKNSNDDYYYYSSDDKLINSPSSLKIIDQTDSYVVFNLTADPSLYDAELVFNYYVRNNLVGSRNVSIQKLPFNINNKPYNGQIIFSDYNDVYALNLTTNENHFLFSTQNSISKLRVNNYTNVIGIKTYYDITLYETDGVEIPTNFDKTSLFSFNRKEGINSFNDATYYGSKYSSADFKNIYNLIELQNNPLNIHEVWGEPDDFILIYDHSSYNSLSIIKNSYTLKTINLPSNTSFIDAQISNNGKTIAWIEEYGYYYYYNNDSFTIKTYNIETNNTTTLYTSSSEISQLAFSPDDSQICFSAKLNSYSSAYHDLYLISSSSTTSTPTNITNSSSIDEEYFDWN